MSATALLPPVTAVRMVWALTGAASNDTYSQLHASVVEEALKNIAEQAKSDELENKYAISAIATMNANRRSLDVVYKGRQLNFEENEKLRKTYLDSVQESLDFGKKAQDVLKSLPAMTVTGAVGVTLGDWLGASTVQMWAIGLGLAAVGYFINVIVVRSARKRTQRLYVQQDYERSLYYDQYIRRVTMILTSLYRDLDRIHKNVFGTSYPIDQATPEIIVEDLLKGAHPTFCVHIHECMRNEKIRDEITDRLWPLCETGKAASKEDCAHWDNYPAHSTSTPRSTS